MNYQFILGVVTLLIGILNLVKVNYFVNHSKIYKGKLIRFYEILENDYIETHTYYHPVVLYYDDEVNQSFSFTGLINPFKINIGDEYELRVFKKGQYRKAYLNNWWNMYFVTYFILFVASSILLNYFLN